VIKNPAKWKEFRNTIKSIESKALAPHGKIYTTGYAKFFAPPRENDACDNTYFFPRRILAVLPMKYSTRSRMNDLVGLVNAQIETNIAGSLKSATFVDIDDHFTGRRFCEPENEEDPIGADNPNVLFNDLTTTFEEDATWNPDSVSRRPEEDPWAAWALDLPESVQNDTDWVPRGIGDNLQRASSFHPKKAAHISTTIKVANMIFIDFAG